MKTARDRVVIAGGGIGGLAAALALARRGVPCIVLERSARFGEIGAGIQLGPNAFHAFDALGIGAEARALAVHVDNLRLMDAVAGHEIARIPLGDGFRARFANPYAVVHRGDLHRLLLRACEADPSIDLRTGAEVSGYGQDDRTAWADLPDGRARGCAVIGADGLWSPLRAQMLGDAVQISGHTTYRSVIPAGDMPEALRWNDAVLWAGPKCHVVHYPLRGGDAFNLVVTVHDHAPAPVAGAPAETDAVIARFAHLAPPVRAVVERGRDYRLWVLCDRAPVAEWSDGRVALLGDAAHPMLQYMAQGACMALEDAVALGHLFDRADVPGSLRAYCRRRAPRTARVQLQSRAVGEHVYHPAGAHAQLRDLVVANRTAAEWFDQIGWLYGSNGLEGAVSSGTRERPVDWDATESRQSQNAM